VFLFPDGPFPHFYIFKQRFYGSLSGTLLAPLVFPLRPSARVLLSCVVLILPSEVPFPGRSLSLRYVSRRDTFRTHRSLSSFFPLAQLFFLPFGSHVSFRLISEKCLSSDCFLPDSSGLSGVSPPFYLPYLFRVLFVLLRFPFVRFFPLL